MRGCTTATSACCLTTTACRSANSTPPGGGCPAHRRSTFRSSTMPSGSSSLVSERCSMPPRPSGRARSTPSTSSVAHGHPTKRLRPSQGCATGQRSAGCSCTSNSSRGPASPTWRRPGISCVRRTGPTAASCSTPGTTSGATPTGRCCAPFLARPFSACSSAMRRPRRSPNRSTPRCTRGFCRATANWRCPPCWRISAPPARRLRSGRGVLRRAPCTPARGGGTEGRGCAPPCPGGRMRSRASVRTPEARSGQGDAVEVGTALIGRIDAAHHEVRAGHVGGSHTSRRSFSASRRRAGGATCLHQWSRLDTTLMTRATMTAPNKYERRAWERAILRIFLVVRFVSDT